MMCEHMHYLSQIDRLRWIAICEHGTIHLSWDHLVLFITPRELVKLGMTLDVAITQDHRFNKHKETFENETQHWSVPEEGFFNIWVGRYALQLTPVDYLLFGSLVSRAINNLTSEMLDGRPCTVAMCVEEKIEPAISVSPTPEIRFSIN